MQPLAHRMRPKTLAEVCGQTHLIGPAGILSRFVTQKQIFSLIFYGPPGCGKTTLATVLADELQRPYRFFNAVIGNKKDLETIFQEAKFYPGMILIMDEVHRLNKDKQDLLLPHLEDGTITLIGATTANPLFSINPALRSRTHLLEIKAIEASDIIKALERALTSNDGYQGNYTYDFALLEKIANQANGDVRYALNMLELAVTLSENQHLASDALQQFLQIPNLKTDADGDGHYDLLSAFQKSIRGSDVDAALLYLASLLEIGDLASLERRLLVTAYEDIGLANPNAVMRASQAITMARSVGMPEARIIYANAIIELALSPKSKSAEAAIDAALQTIRKTPYQVPDYLRLTPVSMQEEDKYDYGRSDLWNLIQYLPDRFANLQFYQPEKLTPAEQVYFDNYQKLRLHKRSNQLAQLKQGKKPRNQ
ncbi:MAG: replication-associated recombination protein A [Erysipelotrichaceae bacterium]